MNTVDALMNYLRKQYAEFKKIYRILRTPYYSLLLPETARLPLAVQGKESLEILEQDQEWKLIKIGNYKIYWPAEFDHNALVGLYCETFEPIDQNPHAYERRNLRISPGDWVIDAGACEGFFTYYALDRGAKVLLIEPVPRLVEALSLTFHEQVKSGSVKILAGALTRHKGNIYINIPENQVYCSNVCSTSYNDNIAQPVQAFTLDQIADEGIVPRIDFVKMDIEGGEIDAIYGAENVLIKQQPKLSIAVYHGLNNAFLINQIIKRYQPKYHVSWRGMFYRPGYGLPRPYILHAIAKREPLKR